MKAATFDRDECGQVFAESMRASGMTFPDGMSVLEIGCCEFNWLRVARQTWPNVMLTGIDWRKTDPTEGVTIVRGDVLRHDFPEASFDAVVSVSTIEHIGLGHYDADPKVEDGDTQALRRAWTWLKPGGWLYFDVPWNVGPYMVVGTKFRCYDDEQHAARLRASAPWSPVWSGWFARERPHVRAIPERPKAALMPEHKQFYHYASVWQKA